MNRRGLTKNEKAAAIQRLEQIEKEIHQFVDDFLSDKAPARTIDDANKLARKVFQFRLKIERCPEVWGEEEPPEMSPMERVAQMLADFPIERCFKC